MFDAASLPAALDRIDPQSRALIELSHRRGLPDGYIEELLALGEGGLATRKAAAEIELAAELRVGREELQRGLAGLDAAGWTGEAPSETPVEEPEEWDSQAAVAEQPVETEPVAAEPEKSSGGGRVIRGALAALALAVIVAVVLVANIKDDKKASKVDTTATVASEKTTTAGPPARPNPVVVLRRLNGTNGKGTAQLVESGGQKRVLIKVRDFLEPKGGGYAVWLYNSPSDAKLLYTTPQTKFTLSLPLPLGYERFKSIDISREADANPGHMGLSLLRTSFAALQKK